MSATPSPRPLWAAAIDRAVGWTFGLPAETCNYTNQAVKIPLPDGTVLAADLYRPTGHNPSGTILVRGPYGRGIALSLLSARVFASRGYAVLLVSSRGTFGSTGSFDPFRCEAQDGHGVVAWMREQPWYTGTFATLGGSYLGFTQWALLSDPPHDMVAAVINAGPHDFAERAWGTGAFAMQQHILWADTIAYQETRSFWAQAWNFANPNRLDSLMNRHPLKPALVGHFGGRVPWLFHHVGQSDIELENWALARHGAALDKADVPILLVTAWHDLFFEQTMEQYEALSQRGCPVALRIGSGGHVGGQSGESATVAFQWLERHLAGKGKVESVPPVKIWREGEDADWLELAKWPPPRNHKELFLASDGRLRAREPSHAGSASFTFDPSRPTPTVGGALLFGRGSVDDTALCSRGDVVTFTTGPLPEALDIFGRPSVDMVHSSDNPFCDVFVRLSVVDAQGRCRNVTEQYRRIDASRDGKLIALDMPDTAYRVPAGSRVRLVVAGGCFPKYGVNLGTGKDPATGTVLRRARHTIRFGGDYGSCLVVPVLKKS
ncbi:Cocaine esterase [Colletotrichum trifolii]|uniref:Cocaine esterase n=1 Tax=Colletotrichum trifolii TaxID=5466 RepID=A0A4R8RQJ5_COLTR|nr:Cocaine esterase [Colletotrichum trifolii]